MAFNSYSYFFRKDMLVNGMDALRLNMQGLNLIHGQNCFPTVCQEELI